MKVNESSQENVGRVKKYNHLYKIVAVTEELMQIRYIFSRKTTKIYSFVQL